MTRLALGSSSVFERYTERVRQVVVLAQDEARALKHNYIGTEHILLGLVRENEGVAARILLDLDADAEKVRHATMNLLAEPSELESSSPKTPPVAPELAEELDRVRQERKEAIEAQQFELAATLRARERLLISTARALEAAGRAATNRSHAGA
jgi:ATP-dependent Clp protease ATP-binding subunit ClpA